MAFLWICTFLAACLAALTAGYAVVAGGAPQQAAAAAIALCIAVIPYIFTRACEGMENSRWRREMLAEARKANGSKG